MDKKHAKKILEEPHGRLWTVQGFGKMSTNITDNARLHIWDRCLLDPRVPAVHSHSWAFKSVVLAGCVRNLKLGEEPVGDKWNKILVASTGGVLGHQEVVRLREDPIEVYREAETYVQRADEIHWSLPEDGSVTLVEWEFGGPSKHMKVFWRGLVPWRDAKSRQATEHEVLSVTRNALDSWF